VTDTTASTRATVRALYDAFLAGDVEAMLARCAEDVEVRFLGQATVHGRAAARRFFAFAGPLLRDVDFRLEAIVADREVGAGIWSESATTADGTPWRNHGVDVVHVRGGEIVALHENNDVRLVHAHFPPYDPEPQP
jgi:ketosteroid isomerase-like protein